MFNTSMLYECNALRPFAEACLARIDPDGEHAEARDRLLNLLSFFEPMDIAWVPHNSILREFVGGSIYA
jgi:uridine kinase